MDICAIFCFGAWECLNEHVGHFRDSLTIFLRNLGSFSSEYIYLFIGLMYMRGVGVHCRD